MEDKTLNKIIIKAAAMAFIDRLKYCLMLEELSIEKDEAFCSTLKNSIKSIKEYHKID